MCIKIAEKRKEKRKEKERKEKERKEKKMFENSTIRGFLNPLD